MNWSFVYGSTVGREAFPRIVVGHLILSAKQRIAIKFVLCNKSNRLMYVCTEMEKMKYTCFITTVINWMI